MSTNLPGSQPFFRFLHQSVSGKLATKSRIFQDVWVSLFDEKMRKEEETYYKR